MPDEKITKKEELIKFIHKLTDEDCKLIISYLNEKEQPK